MVIPAIIDSSADSSTNGYTADEKASLKRIAVMCPADGGPAVFMARSLVHGWDPMVIFTDDSSCTGYSEDYNGDDDSEMMDRKALTLISSDKYSVYPNPASTSITLKLSLATTRTENVSISDVTGRLQSIYQIAPNSSKLIMPVNTLSNGIYFIKVPGLNINAKFTIVR